ncbi:efflux RND transporter periplasmic adaptor subunit [Parashewanella curva]|uniref:Efflux RND transporter periplasmic adaptor subunit n=1 Tax=Parashewanella curva TaxID=2338552 RepID=A0A3L8PYE6_9GAMM|nr:efflux RND transporter periplasmic adaptor subunit [Parashewanella curva]RLV60285.1 efflux RND transporter periplasmic adaptor subunit [Parashewanella curva]
MKLTVHQCAYLSPLFFALMIAGCGKQPEQTQTAEVVRPVQIYKVKEASSQQSWTFPATISAFKSTELAFNSGGKLTSFNITKGQEVKKGQLLASIDDRDFQLKLNSANANFQTAKLSYERGKKLVKKNIISRSDFDTLESQFKVAESQYDSAKKALKDTKIYAPYDGLIASKQAANHDNVGAGQTVLSLIAAGKFSADFDIPPARLNYINQHHPDGIYVVFKQFDGAKAKADFKEISLLPSKSSQSYQVTMSFTPPKNVVVLPGMSAEVRMDNKLDAKQLDLLIPTKSVISVGDDKFVWKVDPKTMTTVKTPVDIKPGIGEFVAVKSGVHTGDQIITSGASYAVEGMKVSIWQPK